MSHTHERLDAQMWNEKAQGGGAVEVLLRRRWRNYRTRWRRQRRGAAEKGRGMCEEEMQIKRGGYLKGIRCKSHDKNISQRWWHRLELRGVKAHPRGRRGKKKKVLTSEWAARTENNKSVWVETQRKKRRRKSPAAEVKGLRFGYFRHHIMGFLFFFRPHLNRWDLSRWAPISHDEISQGCDPHRCCFFLHLFDFSSDRVKEKKKKRPFLCHPTTTTATAALPDPLSVGELSGWWELSSLYNRKWEGDETYGGPGNIGLY